MVPLFLKTPHVWRPKICCLEVSAGAASSFVIFEVQQEARALDFEVSEGGGPS